MEEMNVKYSDKNFYELNRLFGVDENDIEGDEINLSDIVTIENLSNQLFISTLDEQINSLNIGSYTVTNLIDLFEDRWIYFNSVHEKDAEGLNEAKALRFNFYRELIKKIERKFEINFEYDESNTIPLAKSLYSVLVLNYQANLENFIISYILKNKRNISKRYNNVGKILSFSKKFQKRMDAVIIANLSNIIIEISNNNDITFNDIISILHDNDIDEFDITLIYNFLESPSLMNLVTISEKEPNSFNKNFFKIFLDQDSGYTELIMNIQTKLYGIFPIRTERNS